METRTKKRPTIKAAVEWIALNDNVGTEDDAEAIAGYVSTLLVADLFGADPAVLARRIKKERDEFLAEYLQ